RFSHRFTLLFTHFSYHHTPTTDIYSLSLHDALPILILDGNTCKPSLRIFSVKSGSKCGWARPTNRRSGRRRNRRKSIVTAGWSRSEEHTSELQSLTNLVCRLLLEKKKHAAIRIILEH